MDNSENLASSAVVLSAMQDYTDRLKSIGKKPIDFTGGHVKVSTNDKYQVTLYFGFDKNKNPKSIQFDINKDDGVIWFQSLELFNDEFIKKAKRKKAKAIDTKCTFSMEEYLDSNAEDKEEVSPVLLPVTKNDVDIIPNTEQALQLGSKNDATPPFSNREDFEAEHAQKLQEVEDLCNG